MVLRLGARVMIEIRQSTALYRLQQWCQHWQAISNHGACCLLYAHSLTLIMPASKREPRHATARKQVVIASVSGSMKQFNMYHAALGQWSLLIDASAYVVTVRGFH